jgi:hypothetical protein
MQKSPAFPPGFDFKANDRGLNHLEISSGLLAALGHDFEADLLALVQRAHTSALNRRDVHKHILRAIVRLNEAVALLSIEKFHSSDRHQEFLSSFLLNAHAIIRVGGHKPSFWGVHLRRSPKPGARQQVRRRKRGCGRRHRRISVERQRLTKAASVSDNVL